MPDDRGSAADQLIDEFREVPETARRAWLEGRVMTRWREAEAYGSRRGLADWAASWHTFGAKLEGLGLLQPPERKFVDAFFEYAEWRLGKDLRA